MNKVAVPALLLLFGIIAVRCSKNPVDPGRSELPRALTSQEVQLIESNNLFGLKLFTAVSAAEGDKNVFISPLSVSMALGMTLNGADGQTYDDMREALELAGLTEDDINQSYQSLIPLLTGLDPKVIFQIANSIWYRDIFPIRQTFVDVNREYFSAEVRSLDFNDPGAADIINAWVKDETKGKIEQIVDKPINPLTMAFLINAIYFKGDWTYQFDKSDTKDDDFTLLDGSTKQVPMMEIQDVSFPYYANADFQAVDLAYSDSLFSMTIILPHQGTDIDSIIEGLNKNEWEELIDQFHHMRFDSFRMPKFKLEYKIKLNDVLTALGMGIAFNDALADFSRMYHKEQVGLNLFISKVKHKTFIEVNEEGTEAAAVTSVEMTFESVGPYMIVNRPFIIAIRERFSGTILFIGKIVDPTPVGIV